MQQERKHSIKILSVNGSVRLRCNRMLAARQELKYPMIAMQGKINILCANFLYLESPLELEFSYQGSYFEPLIHLVLTC